MLILVINNEKCLTLNLSKEPNFVLTFLLKSYTTFIRPNFFGKFVQKNFDYTVMILTCVIFTHYSYTAICYYVTALKLQTSRLCVAPWCIGYHYCTTSFNKAWTQVLHRFKPCLRCVRDSRWWVSLTMVPAGNKTKRLSSVNHTTKTIHHHHHLILAREISSWGIWCWNCHAVTCQAVAFLTYHDQESVIINLTFRKNILQILS